MSRHVRNLLTLKGDYKSLCKFKIENGILQHNSLSFNELINMPYRYKYLLTRIYTWRMNNWGTISDAYQVSSETLNLNLNLTLTNQLTYTFCTAYDPPLLWLNKASAAYPAISFYLSFNKNDKDYKISYSTL